MDNPIPGDTLRYYRRRPTYLHVTLYPPAFYRPFTLTAVPLPRTDRISDTVSVVPLFSQIPLLCGGLSHYLVPYSATLYPRATATVRRAGHGDLLVQLYPRPHTAAPYLPCYRYTDFAPFMYYPAVKWLFWFLRVFVITFRCWDHT